MTIDEIIGKMTAVEKVAFLMGKSSWNNYGIERLGIPELTFSDGPSGLRRQAGSGDHLGLGTSLPATCFPSASTLANSWDPELTEAVGAALGEEASAQGVHVLLGPGLNTKRSTLCGRNFEYFSEDPYLSGKLAAGTIRGIQSKGVGACAKHFAVNSQELRRMASDSVIEEDVLRECYLTNFEIAVKEGKPLCIMPSYNKVNGVYANENAHLLKDILRLDWGFDGFTVSDWGADHDRVKSIAAGANVEMPCAGADSAFEVLRALEEGRLSQADLDARVKELLTVVLQLTKEAKGQQIDWERHHALARKAASESIVLLENDGILPLKKETSVALIGDFAKKPRYQGAGSSNVNTKKLDDLVTLFPKEDLSFCGYAKGWGRTGESVSAQEEADAIALAKKAEAVIFCMGLDETSESEGNDRRSLDLKEEQVRMLRKVQEANPNVVLVLFGGAPFLLPEKSLFRGAIHGYLGGEAGAGALWDVLTGAVNPSGRLAETWPLSLESTSVYGRYPCREEKAVYSEGLFIGYRYTTTKRIPVRYPFGYGLSYTTMVYEDLSVSEQGAEVTVRNTGGSAGAEVVQMYISSNNDENRPVRELKGFKKVVLAPGESKRVVIPFDDYTFRTFDVQQNAWVYKAGSYMVSVGRNAEEMIGSAVYKINETRVQKVTASRMAKAEQSSGAALSLDDTFGDLGKGCSKWAGKLVKWMEDQISAKEAKGQSAINFRFVYDMPLGALRKLSKGYVTKAMMEDFVCMADGHTFAGFGRLIKDFVKGRVQTVKFARMLKKNGQKRFARCEG